MFILQDIKLEGGGQFLKGGEVRLRVAPSGVAFLFLAIASGEDLITIAVLRCYKDGDVIIEKLGGDFEPPLHLEGGAEVAAAYAIAVRMARQMHEIVADIHLAQQIWSEGWQS